MNYALNGKGRAALLSTAGLAVLALATPVAALSASPTAASDAAQAAPTPSPDAGNGNTYQNSESIVITAQKRAEPILEIPQSVSVVSGDTLERQQAMDIKQFANLVPGLSLTETNPGNTRIVLRGVNTGGVSTTVGVYVDETPFGSSSGLVNGAILAGDFDTFDVQRIEVLRGPQGTLYGASSLGGVLKYVTVAPKLDSLSVRGRAGIESVHDGGIDWNTDAVVNVPLGKEVAFRASGFYRHDSGWIDGFRDNVTLGDVGSRGGTDVNSDNIYGGRASVLFKPTEQLDIRLTAILQNINVKEPSAVDVDPVSLDPIDGYKRTFFIPSSTDTKYRVYDATINYDFGFASLLSSTSYGRLKQNLVIDGSLVYGPLLTDLGFLLGLPPGSYGLEQDQFTGFKKFTQEFRLTSPSSKTFEWMVGAFYTKEKGKILQDLYAYDLAASDIVPDSVFPGTFAQLPSQYEELAGFVNGTWHVTDRFDLTGGGRYSHNKQSASEVLSGPLAGGGAEFDNLKSSESVFTYSVAPHYQFSDRTSAYARVATGYRPGGPNVLAPNPPPGVKPTYKSDRLTNYELGIKTEAGRRLSFDVSAFLIKWKDIQLFQSIDNVGFNANGGKATSKGFEAQSTWRPAKGLSILANAAYTNAHLDEDALDAGGFKGDWLPWVPRWAFSLNGDYDWMLSSSLHAFVGAGYHYVGKEYGDFDAAYAIETGHQRRINAYGEMDLRAGLDFNRFTLEAYVQNLFNSRGLTSATYLTKALLGGPALPGGALQAGVVQPRTIGLALTVNWDK
jgi:outer membrane receptor protein involved in Fe transport